MQSTVDRLEAPDRILFIPRQRHSSVEPVRKVGPKQTLLTRAISQHANAIEEHQKCQHNTVQKRISPEGSGYVRMRDFDYIRETSFQLEGLSRSPVLGL